MSSEATKMSAPRALPLLCRDREKSEAIHNVLTAVAGIGSMSGLLLMLLASASVVSWQAPSLCWNLVAACLWFRGKPWIAA